MRISWVVRSFQRSASSFPFRAPWVRPVRIDSKTTMKQRETRDGIRRDGSALVSGDYGSGRDIGEGNTRSRPAGRVDQGHTRVTIHGAAGGFDWTLLRHFLPPAGFSLVLPYTSSTVALRCIRTFAVLRSGLRRSPPRRNHYHFEARSHHGSDRMWAPAASMCSRTARSANCWRHRWTRQAARHWVTTTFDHSTRPVLSDTRHSIRTVAICLTPNPSGSFSMARWPMVGTTTTSTIGEVSAAACDSNCALPRKVLRASATNPLSMVVLSDTSSTPPPVNRAFWNAGCCAQ